VGHRKSSVASIRACALSLLVLTVTAWCQDTAPPPAQADAMAAAIQELQTQVKELRSVVTEMRNDAAQYRAETSELRRELDATRGQPTTPAAAPPIGDIAPQSPSERVESLEDSYQLLGSKVDEQYQTKVESASKYRVRLSGIALLDLFSNRGMTDNVDIPTYVVSPNPYNSHGSLGGSLRQSEIGLEVFGPDLAGARTSGSVQADFAGGFPNALNGVNAGLFRLRTASLRMDWKKTSIVGGQDNLFLSPLSPTSFASLAVPAFSYGGNLWGWIPQIRVEHHFDLSETQGIILQAGVLDNLTGEPPYSTYGRTAGAGERSGQPGYGIRAAWTRSIFGKPLTVGAAGYFSRQHWGFERYLSGWAGMTDWDVPLTHRLSLSGEFYRGFAIGGLGGAFGQSVLFNGNPLDAASQVQGLDSVGGWSQLKFKVSSKIELNGAFGMDNPFAADLQAFPVAVSYLDPTLGRNQLALGNIIYRPRSNLLFSTEYRHLRTFHANAGQIPADQVSMIMGVLF
jgi:hypothetical protein